MSASEGLGTLLAGSLCIFGPVGSLLIFFILRHNRDNRP